MLKKILPLLSLIMGLAGGGGAAILLAPEPVAEPAEAASDGSASADADHATDAEQTDLEIVKLPNQFVVPVILNNRVRSMMILTVAVEVEPSQADFVRTREPKLRDTFLDELFNLAAIGGFKDEIISRQTLDIVRTALTERARKTLGLRQVSVLVTDMARQDVH